MSLDGWATMITLAATCAMTVLAVRSWRAVGSVSVVLAPLGAPVRPGNPQALAGLKARLATAGLRNPEHLDAYLAAHLLGRVCGIAGALALALAPGAGLAGGLGACLAIAVGFLGVPRAIDMRATSRQQSIR